MLLQWCLKGIAASKEFDDQAAADALNGGGLASAWLRGNAKSNLLQGIAGSHVILSQATLDAHVNNFGVAQAKTPYISLSAGCVTSDPVTGKTTVHSALDTAIGFATGAVWGKAHKGYVFSLWVLVTPKPAPELPGFGEEVRDLNQFHQFGLYHHEGEVAAKLIVPHRQIEYVEKYDESGASQPVNWSAFGLTQTSNRGANREFVSPERVNNLREMI